MKTKGEVVGPDEFVIAADTLYPVQQRELGALLAEASRHGEQNLKPTQLEEGKKLLVTYKSEPMTLLLAALHRLLWLCLRGGPLRENMRAAETHTDYNLKLLNGHQVLETCLSQLIANLTGRKFICTEEDLLRVIDIFLTGTKKTEGRPLFDLMQTPVPGVLPFMLDELEKRAAQGGLTPTLKEPVIQLHATMKEWEWWAGYKKSVFRLAALLSGSASVPDAALPEAGEGWADALREDVTAMKPAERKAWLALLANIPKSTVAKPTAKWKSSAMDLLKTIGEEEFAVHTEKWFALVGLRIQSRINERNGLILRSLVWYASLLRGETICRALANIVEGGLRKITAGSLYASSLSKAAISALQEMEGLEPVAQLSRLKHRIKSPWGLEEVQKALGAAITRTGISEDELEEISLPTFGLDAEGRMSRSFGDTQVELAVVGTKDIEFNWTDAKGKSLSKEPAALKKDEDYKSFKLLGKDIGKVLGAQRDRIERLYLGGRTWPMSVWKARYLDHPLVANQVRRLVWWFNEPKGRTAGFWRAGKILDVKGKALDWIKEDTLISLWHPLETTTEEVVAWRDRLEAINITQPFKQVYREIYLLTDAERETRTYSNRFAAHILRQHQLKALCDHRGWKYDFLGNWDGGDHRGATLSLPQSDLHLQFWTDYAGGDYSEAGVALYVSSDQVRFQYSARHARPLENVPPLVLSEAMRDVDLFVSVSSIGADETWQNTAQPAQQQPAHQTYWRQFVTGELNETARTRRKVLERLVPKLKIAARCTLEDRFLVVRGQLHTYKIHLGSGNIFIEPGSRYLCIVPDRSAATHESLSLPFEGDSMLSVILSKAFVLAEDDKIKDQSIVNQIKAV